MPDLLQMGSSWVVAAAVAAGCLGICVGWSRVRSSAVGRMGWILGIGAGLYAGCGVLGLWPRWRIVEDIDRFLILLLPAVVFVEILTANRASRSTWVLRAVMAGVAAPILLHRTSYLSDLTGPDTAEWSAFQATIRLTVIGAAMLAPWICLSQLAAHTSRVMATLPLLVTSLGSALTVMTSGYLRGGFVGLAVCGAIAGPVVIASFRREQEPTDSGLGVTLLGIFTVLVMGRFFGSLPTSWALTLWFAPLGMWIPMVSILKRYRPRTRASLGMAVVVVVTTTIVAVSVARFVDSSTRHSLPSVVTPQGGGRWIGNKVQITNWKRA